MSKAVPPHVSFGAALWMLAVCWVGLAASSVATGPPPNLLANPCFEDAPESVATGWALPEGHAEVTTADAWRGTQALRIEREPDGFRTVVQRIPAAALEPGARYALHAYARCGERAGFALKLVAAAGGAAWTETAAHPGRPAWARVALEFTVPDTGFDGPLELQLLVRPPAQSAITVDSLALRRADMPWQSAHYPATEADNRLPDFSYAGYRAGAALDLPPGLRIFAVAAPAAGGDIEPALRAAIAQAVAAGGGVVQLPPGTFECRAPVRVAADRIFIRGSDAAPTHLIFTTPATELRERSHPAQLAFTGTVETGEPVPLRTRYAAHARKLSVAREDAPQVGDVVAIGWPLNAAFYRAFGMLGTWPELTEEWLPAYVRRVAAVEEDAAVARVTLDAPLPYAPPPEVPVGLARQWGYVREVGLENVVLSERIAPHASWLRRPVQLVEFNGAYHAWCQGVRSAPAPGSSDDAPHFFSGGIRVNNSRNVTVADCSLARPFDRGAGGCGYLFTIERSSDVLIRDCEAREGRHNFIVNRPFGTSGVVFLRCTSIGSRSYEHATQQRGWAAFSEYHHALAIACLVDSCRLEDGWLAGNRLTWSEGAGITSVGGVFWNNRGGGFIGSWQAGRGWVIGTDDIKVAVGLHNQRYDRYTPQTEPEDIVEGDGVGATLEPRSLYEAQRQARLAAGD